MTCLRITALLLWTGAALFGQFLSGISQSVSRVITVTPDQAAFSVAIDTTSETTIETLLGLLKKVEITGKDLVGQGTDVLNYPPELQNHYTFSFTVAPGRLLEVAKNLDSLRQDLPAGIRGLQFSAFLGASLGAIESITDSSYPNYSYGVFNAQTFVYSFTVSITFGRK